MSECDKFAHGYHYGDYSGVVFYGPPKDGFWLERLAVSDVYIGPLFRAVLDRAWRDSGGDRTPRLASEWNTLEGWAACAAGRVPVSPEDARELVATLSQVTIDDIAPYCAGCTPDECLQCAEVIQEFVTDMLACGGNLFIEHD